MIMRAWWVVVSSALLGCIACAPRRAAPAPKNRVATQCTAGFDFSTEPVQYGLPNRPGEPLSLIEMPLWAGRQPNEPVTTLIDLVGDARPDLVILVSEKDSTLGRRKWLVHRATDTGFEVPGVDFALPQGLGNAAGSNRIFAQTAAQRSYCGPTTDSWNPAFSLVDLTQDGKPDLVVKGSCGPNPVGVTHWGVFAAEGAGFASSAKLLPLPGEHAHNAMSGRADCSLSLARLFDLTGDGQIDLVRSSSCTYGGPKSAWLVYSDYFNKGVADVKEWPVPVIDERSGLPGIRENEPREFSFRFRHDLADFNGDGRVDLVVTHRPEVMNKSNASWQVYWNTGSGFSLTPATLRLPTGFTDENLPTLLSGRRDSHIPDTRFQFLDFTGDAIPDLLVEGKWVNWNFVPQKWRLFLGSSAGFAGKPIELSVPDWVVDVRVGDARCTMDRAPAPRFDVRDLTGDELPDLIVTRACHDEKIGEKYWLVYRGECRNQQVNN